MQFVRDPFSNYCFVRNLRRTHGDGPEPVSVTCLGGEWRTGTIDMPIRYSPGRPDDNTGSNRTTDLLNIAPHLAGLVSQVV